MRQVSVSKRTYFLVFTWCEHIAFKVHQAVFGIIRDAVIGSIILRAQHYQRLARFIFHGIVAVLAGQNHLFLCIEKTLSRSEERRVGKECRSRWGAGEER